MVLLSAAQARASGWIARTWRALPAAWRQAIVVALVLRVALAVLAFAAGGLLPGLDPVSVAGRPGTGFDGWTAASSSGQGVGLLGAGLERFDALWYLGLARDGYPALTDGVPQAAAFFPGYPLVVGGVGRVLLGHWLLAASLVSLAATVVALAGIHRLAEDMTGDPAVARRAVLVTAVFPASFFLLAPYSESLFLAAATWALVHSRRGAWWPAAGAGVVAGCTRGVGVLLAIPVAIEVWRRIDAGTSRRSTVAAVAAVSGGAAGLGLVVLHAWWRWGDLLAPWSVQGGWQRELTWPWQTVIDAVRTGTGSPGVYPGGYHTLDLLVFVPVVLASVWLLTRRHVGLGLFALANVGVWLVTPFPPRPLMSTPRFALALAPVFVAFAMWLGRESLRSTWMAASGALLGIHAALYVGWYFVF